MRSLQVLKDTLFLPFLGVILLLAGPAGITNAQNVKGGITGGFTASQVEGDNTNGFYKVGFNAGAIAVLPLSHHFTMRGELLFNQKGSRTYPTQDIEFARFYNVSLDYIEVPLTVHYHDQQAVNFGAGVSIGALIRAREQIKQPYTQLPGNLQEQYPYEQFDVSVVVGGNYLFHPQWAVNLRWGYSLLPVRQNPPPFNAARQYNHFVTLRAIYYFHNMFDPNRDETILIQ